MGETGYTPGLLAAHERGIGLDGSALAFELQTTSIPSETVVPPSEITADDARRLVAAWNAVAGIPTEALEAGVVGEMREALRYMLVAHDTMTGHGSYLRGEQAPDCGICGPARAALAKASPGGAR